MDPVKQQPIGHATAYIDLSALISNVITIKRYLANKSLCAVIKANAYGHGARVIAQTLQRIGVDSFGVALVEEAVSLRKANIWKQIIVWDCSSDTAFDAVSMYGITPVLGTVEQLELFATKARFFNAHINVHIEVDTGMARSGIDVRDIGTCISIAKAHAKYINITGLMTHLADIHNDCRSTLQFHLLDNAHSAILKQTETCLVHVDSSSSIVNGPSVNSVGMVRCGLLLYGVQPSKELIFSGIRPIMSLKTTIVAIRNLPTGSPVGYGRSYYTKRSSYIGTIPIGYADGYKRCYSHRASVIVRGNKVPVVGEICMDACMIDVTDIECVSVGDDVTLMGTQLGQTITADDLASWGKTISYDVLCSISSRLPRCYVNSSNKCKL